MREHVFTLWVQNTSQYSVPSGEEIARVSSMGAHVMGVAYRTDGLKRHCKAWRQTPVQRRMDDILQSLGKGDDADGVHSSPSELEQAPSGNTVMVITRVPIGPAGLKRPKQMV